MTNRPTSPEIPPKASSINLRVSDLFDDKTSILRRTNNEAAAMVLDEASPQSSGSMPTSDGQQYEGSPLTIPSASNLRLQINPESIVTPDPFTLYFGFGGNMNWQRNVVRAISERVDNSRVLMGRNPTQEEVDAFVTHSTRSLYEKRIGAPLTGAIVAARLYSQARSSTYFRGMMGLPPIPAAGAAGAESGAKPVMPTLKQMVDGIITTAKVDAAGFRSGLGMVASRFFVWTITGATVSGVFAVYNDAIATFSDSRLADFVKQVKNQDPEELRKRKADASSERHRSIQQQRQRQNQGQGQDQDQLSTEVVGFDQSPQQQQQGVAAGIAESQNYEQQNNGYASLYSDNKSNSQREQQQQQQQAYEPRPSSQDSVSDFFDDASPTAPEYQGTPAPSTVTTTPTPQRGAWERIRQQNLGFGGQQGQQENSNSSDDIDRYQEYNARYGGNTSSYQSYGTGNNSDNDRQREREQARAEFERMLDAERNMSSDDSSSSSGRGGRGGWWK